MENIAFVKVISQLLIVILLKEAMHFIFIFGTFIVLLSLNFYLLIYSFGPACLACTLKVRTVRLSVRLTMHSIAAEVTRLRRSTCTVRAGPAPRPARARTRTRSATGRDGDNDLQPVPCKAAVTPTHSPPSPTFLQRGGARGIVPAQVSRHTTSS